MTYSDALTRYVRFLRATAIPFACKSLPARSMRCWKERVNVFAPSDSGHIKVLIEAARANPAVAAQELQAAIVVSRDLYVIGGCALWATRLAVDPLRPLPTLVVDLPISDLARKTLSFIHDYPEPSPTTSTIVRLTTDEGLNFWVESASTPQRAATGLSGRTALPADWGMLFLFPQARILSFWMRNTRIPLSIAFLRNGSITSIQDLVPLDERHALSPGPADSALEMPRGWFDAAGVKVGSRIQITGGGRP